MTLVAVVACDYVRPSEPFVPEEQLIVLAVVLNAGWKSAYLLATYPHKAREDRPPVVYATLGGPHGSSAFVDSVAVKHCSIQRDAVAWPGPHICMRATMLAPVQPGNRYTLEGTTALGSFRGATVVPRPVIVHEPVGESRHRPADTIGLAVRFESPPEVRALTVEVADGVQVVVDSTTGKVSEKPWWAWYVIPDELDPRLDTADLTVYLDEWHPPEVRFNVHLLGFDGNYGRFLEYRDTRVLAMPWPEFGIKGDPGVFGYFGSTARSRPVSVIVREP